MARAWNDLPLLLCSPEQELAQQRKTQADQHSFHLHLPHRPCFLISSHPSTAQQTSRSRMLAGELKPQVSEMTALSATWPKVLSLLLMVFKFGLKQNPLGYLLSRNFSLPPLTQLVSGHWSLHCTLSPPCPYLTTRWDS